ncbi:MAG: glutaminyl-tRNA synthase (glutamine-hydrolyzing) subunit B [Chloroflexi bacterium GWC2_73_18]|nr:MAG: glutaminyl-tRNA synthase (glutamine-hydrolyzing) subunit B [Chloroflexi bacterium GWC2_73_18]
MSARYETVIGIEIHVQLKTASKMFCRCPTDIEGAPPNSRTCPICLGLPGTLPVANRRAVELVLETGMALEAEIVPVTRWDRKNYFYPDLPKGYQISQYELPLTRNGRLAFETSEGPVTVGIRRAHLEEDTARLVHAADPGGRRVSLVDFNRSGMPLMEIVTEPDLRTPEQARRYAEELRLLLRAIGASDAEMEQGQMRVEANVSIRPVGEAAFGTRAEVKNMNSFRSVERAIAYEVERQERVLDAGEPLVQETRGWDDDRGVTYTMRIKEGSDDYRYFPEPDLPPLRADPAWLEEIRGRLPELPAARRGRYTAGLGLSPYDARVIVADAGATALFEETLAAAGGLGLAGVTPKLVANWVSGEYLRLAKQATGEEVELAESAGAAARVRPEELARLIGLVADGSLSGTSAKQVFERHFTAGEPVEAIVTDLGLTQISDRDALAAAVEDVIAANAAAVADYRAGRQQALGFLVGQVMRATRGRANAALVAELLRGGLDDGGTTG